MLKKRYLFLLAAATAAAGAYGLSFVFGSYSTGARAGDLVKYSSKGLIFKTGEGELQLGRDSGRAAANTVQSAEENPWRFSSSGGVYEASEHLIGQPVVIDYRQPYFTFRTFGDTEYRVKTITPVDKTTPAACGGEGSGWKSSGTRIGRVVKASTKGRFFQTNEVAIQVGDSGNQFLDMSAPDAAIFDCAMAFLRSGHKARIAYREDYIKNPLAQNTTYTITGIQAEN